VAEDPEVTKREVYAELDKVVVKYNINVLKFRYLSWYKEEYLQTLAAAWEKVVKDEIRDPGAVKVDLAKLEADVLNKDERRVLKEGMLLLHPELPFLRHQVKPPA